MSERCIWCNRPVGMWSVHECPSVPAEFLEGDDD